MEIGLGCIANVEARGHTTLIGNQGTGTQWSVKQFASGCPQRMR